MINQMVPINKRTIPRLKIRSKNRHIDCVAYLYSRIQRKNGDLYEGEMENVGAKNENDERRGLSCDPKFHIFYKNCFK